MIDAISDEAPCPICLASAGRVIHRGSRTDIYRCADCGVDFAGFHQTIDEGNGYSNHFAGLDLVRYNRSVRATRISSYRQLLARVQALVPSGTWLDIGCSYGWLLEAAGASGYRTVGIEPSRPAAEQAISHGHDVRIGTFPVALDTRFRCDVASLIDVLEHLAKPVEALLTLRQHLNPGGLVVVQVPDQTCLLYRTAEALCRTTAGRVDFAFQRLWLSELDFPHRFYFARRSLAQLLDRCGYRVLVSYRSPISRPAEARDRVAYYARDKLSSSWAVAAAVGAINTIDAATGHGGLLTMIAQPNDEVTSCIATANSPKCEQDSP